MAQFYASIQGNRGEATRMGTKASGINGHIRGWNVGAEVFITHVNGVDVVEVFRTGGSHWNSRSELIAKFTEEDKNPYGI